MKDNFLAWERQAVCSARSVVGNRIIVVKSSANLARISIKRRLALGHSAVLAFARLEHRIVWNIGIFNVFVATFYFCLMIIFAEAWGKTIYYSK